MKTDWPSLVRELREEAGLSQRELSRRTGVNRSSIRRLENGAARGEVDTLEILLDCLGYEVEVVVKSAPKKDHHHGEDHEPGRSAFH